MENNPRQEDLDRFILPPYGSYHLSGISLTQAVMDWCASSRHPRVLHVFSRVCNLINERGEILSVVTPRIGEGPFNLVVKENISFEEYVDVGAAILILHDHLVIGDLTVDLQDARLWNPCCNWEMLHARCESVIDALTQLPTTKYHFPNLLSSCLVIADLPASMAAAKQLAGAGIGLTPSGDDFIIGALYATWIIHPPETTRVLAEEIAACAAPLTTSLSAALLRFAGRGEAGILWHKFFDALISSEVDPIRSAMDEISVVGATSGGDALAGFISTLLSYVDTRKTHVFSTIL